MPTIGYHLRHPSAGHWKTPRSSVHCSDMSVSVWCVAFCVFRCSASCEKPRLSSALPKEKGGGLQQIESLAHSPVLGHVMCGAAAAYSHHLAALGQLY